MHDDAAPTAGHLTRQQLLPLLTAFLGAPVLLLVLLGTVLGMPEGNPPTAWVVVLALALSTSFLLAETIGFRTTALPTELAPEEAARISAGRFRQLLIIRFAIAETPILLGLVFSFAADNLWLYIFGLVLGWPMLAFLTWPSSRNLEKVRRQLESGGARSYLDLG